MGLSKNWTSWKTRIHKINIINKNDLLYLAGLVDGEGCIGLNIVGSPKVRQNLHPQVTITNTNKEILDWVMIIVGKGKVEYRHSNNLRHKLSESVIAERNRIKDVLTQLNKRGKDICVPRLVRG